MKTSCYYAHLKEYNVVKDGVSRHDRDPCDGHKVLSLRLQQSTDDAACP